jgi:hypothetical protein
MKLYSKDELITAIRELGLRGWIENTDRQGNHGAIGNILEDILGIEENNLPIPNAAEWELKAGRSRSNILTTLLHMEPSPRAIRFVPSLLLPNYGWVHANAGSTYPKHEMSFRQTLSATRFTDRGFTVKVDRLDNKITISFDSSKINAQRHQEWYRRLEQSIGLAELNPQPYWGFDDITYQAGTKLLNMFYITAQRQVIDGKEFFKYDRLLILSKFSPNNFINMVEQGLIFIDFDARTGHNHGTKFRIKSRQIPNLYEHQTLIELG